MIFLALINFVLLAVSQVRFYLNINNNLTRYEKLENL